MRNNSDQANFRYLQAELCKKKPAEKVVAQCVDEFSLYFGSSRPWNKNNSGFQGDISVCLGTHRDYSLWSPCSIDSTAKA